HLPVARGSAGPVHRPGPARLPGRRGRGRDGPPPAGPRLGPARPGAGDRRRPAAGHAGVAGERAVAPGPAGVRGRADRRHPQPSAGGGGRLAARHTGAGPAGPWSCRAGRPRVRDAGGHQGGRGARAGPPPGAAAGDVGAAGDRGGRHRRGPGHRARPARCLVTRWSPAPRTRSLATAALRGLLAGIVTGHAALVLLAAPALGALALMPRRRPRDELAVDVALSGSRCFEGEDVTITATVRAAGGRALDEITIELQTA